MTGADEQYAMKPIGWVRHQAPAVPRHWSVSDVEGELHLDPAYEEGLADVRAGQHIVVLFVFHRSGAFTPSHLRQTPPHAPRPRGVFSICSPVRPNPLGLSILEVLEVRGPVLRVRGLDMYDGTPILDLKPNIQTAPAAAAPLPGTE